ncbi:DUF262 domain-containing protein [Pontibacter akesuensis]|uniref:GmrSD restriction endonucleases N-terminal domain-containing protein n=1 Tax=Pontibacter akesuensis TaxID=388950 RepID=A0A1I7JC10_9BACT|nr:DUF262 domain-containing protein [Pontibacter akesuensis]GHA71062.1 hypothetical protein GCM10007389_25630 [Pontibacter akesuensis]SFU82757.1 Protein of unknown function DUF262 [Pontibacter akesuensis]
MTKKLDASIPANNWKIIELYNKIKKGELNPSPYFQRKLVWKKPHKYKFIDTIRLNYPFPEVYIAQGSIDIEKMQSVDLIVDGQQRCTTIEHYIEGVDVFALPESPVIPFKELTPEEKTGFLNYEVSIRYLKNASSEQITEIFQRINSTDYALNDTERLNAKWGDSDFIYFAKQLIEKKVDRNLFFVNYEVDPENRSYFLDFFYEKYSVFSDTYVNRMLALQYVMTLIVTLIEGAYFKRNDRVQDYIEKFNEEFTGAGELEVNLLKVLKFIDSLNLGKRSYWFNKANLFTLIVELYNYDLSSIDPKILKSELEDLDNASKVYRSKKTFDNRADEKITADQTQYFVFAREAVNEQTAREYRGSFLRKLIENALIIT